MAFRPVKHGSTQLKDRSIEAGKLAPAGNAAMGATFVIRLNVAAGPAADVSFTATHKFRVLDVWAVHTGGAGEASDTLTIKNGTNAITDAMDWSGADNAVVRAGTIDDAYHEVAVGGTLVATPVDFDAGDDVGAGTVYALCEMVT